MGKRSRTVSPTLAHANTPTIESLNEKTVMAFLLSLTPLDIINAECKDFLALAIGGLTHDAQGARMPVAKSKDKFQS